MDSNIEPNAVVHGDCVRLLPRVATESVKLVLADPPYGIDYKSGFRAADGDFRRSFANDKQPFIWWICEAARTLTPDGSIICFCRWDVMHVFASIMRYAGLDVRSLIVWDKGTHGMGWCSGAFGPQHEMALFGAKSKAFAFPGKRPVDVVRVPKINGTQLLHPAQKPVELLEYFINALTVEGDTMLDPFLGCGSSAVAAIRTGRRYIGMELDDHFYRMGTARISEEAARWAGGLKR